MESFFACTCSNRSGAAAVDNPDQSEKFLPLFKKKHLHIKGGKLDYTSFSDTKVCLLSENSQKIMEGY